MITLNDEGLLLAFSM